MSSDSNVPTPTTLDVGKGPTLTISVDGIDILSSADMVESPLEGSVEVWPGTVPDSAIDGIVEEEKHAESHSLSPRTDDSEQPVLPVLPSHTRKFNAKKMATDPDANQQQAVNEKRNNSLGIFRKITTKRSPTRSEFLGVEPSAKSKRVSVSLLNLTKSFKGSKLTLSTSMPSNSLLDSSSPPATSSPEGSRKSSSHDGAPSRQESSPRMPLSPTIHNLGSILKEAKEIDDEESRRLSEMAFLDM
jgi:hypothetical protein